MAAAVIMMPSLAAPETTHGTGGDLTPPHAGVVRHRRQVTTQPTVTPPAMLADRDTLLALAQHWDSAGGRGFGQSRCRGWNATSAAELCHQTYNDSGCIGCNEDNTTIVGLCKIS